MPRVSHNIHPSSNLTRSISPQNSSSPLIAPEQRLGTEQEQSTVSEGKSRKQFFNLGRSKSKENDSMAAMDVPLAIDATAAAQSESAYLEPAAELKTKTKPVPISPGRLPYANSAAVAGAMASSPGRFRSASPRLHSPASSEIFERSVQEPVPISTLSGEPSAHLPSHVMTEDHIPPALEASAQAITSQELNPDEVKIVTSTSHQPAAVSVLEASNSQVDMASLNSPLLSQKSDETDSAAQSQLLPTAGDEDAGTYGSIDPNDVRRLSFISFADVVQSEHQHPAVAAEGSRENIAGIASAITPTQPIAIARAPSPLRSPRSPASSISHSGIATPPLVAARAIVGAESSPSRSLGAGPHGELTIETMRQAVRKTASGDLGQSFRSPAMSPVLSNDEAANRSRTNS